MNFFVTTAALLNEATIRHLDRSSYDVVFSEVVGPLMFEGFIGHDYLGTINHAIEEDQEFLYMWDGVVSLCGTSSETLLSNSTIEAQQSLHHYTTSVAQRTSYDSPRQHLKYSSLYTCVLYDFDQSRLWLIADYVGATPLWYAFQPNGGLMVTTDLLGAYHSGYTDPTALGPGQIMLIDVKAMEIISISHSRRKGISIDNTVDSGSRKNEILSIQETYSTNLFIRSIHAVLMNTPMLYRMKHDCYGPLSQCIHQHHINGHDSPSMVIMTTELDRMDSSSLLLDCTMEALSINRSIRTSRPMVSEGVQHDYHTIYSTIMSE